MEIDLSPLNLTKSQQIEFCHKRIDQQTIYIERLQYRRPYQKKKELKTDAKEIKTAFIKLLNQLTLH